MKDQWPGLHLPREYRDPGPMETILLLAAVRWELSALQEHINARTCRSASSPSSFSQLSDTCSCGPRSLLLPGAPCALFRPQMLHERHHLSGTREDHQLWEMKAGSKQDPFVETELNLPGFGSVCSLTSWSLFLVILYARSFSITQSFSCCYDMNTSVSLPCTDLTPYLKELFIL